MTELLLAVLLLVGMAAGVPLFVTLGTATVGAFLIYGGLSPLEVAFTVSQRMFGILNNDAILAIPFFVLAGMIMSRGSISTKLIDFAVSLVGWIPGGMAIAAVMACMTFAAISGSSPVTVVAIGMFMYPALLDRGYPDRFSLGLVTSAGSLGILIPPSIPMIIYAIMVEGVGVGNLFLAGIGPGLLIGGVLMGYSVVTGVIHKLPTEPFVLSKAMKAFKDGFWGIMLPVLILGGIYSGLLTVNEAAAASVVYALFVEMFVYREFRAAQVPDIFIRGAVEMGAILIIVAVAAAFSHLLTLLDVPDLITELLHSNISTTNQFLILVNIILLVAGCLMDIISAILILAPVIWAVGREFGIDPVHLGIIFIVNLEIGYLTPPLGMNLFVSSAVFKKSYFEVIRGVVPFVLIMLGCLLLITYVPEISLKPVEWFGSARR